jgi:hypothetical protein
VLSALAPALVAGFVLFVAVVLPVLLFGAEPVLEGTVAPKGPPVLVLLPKPKPVPDGGCPKAPPVLVVLPKPKPKPVPDGGCPKAPPVLVLLPKPRPVPDEGCPKAPPVPAVLPEPRPLSRERGSSNVDFDGPVKRLLN